jgi:hypothetical protein
MRSPHRRESRTMRGSPTRHILFANSNEPRIRNHPLEMRAGSTDLTTHNVSIPRARSLQQLQAFSTSTFASTRCKDWTAHILIFTRQTRAWFCCVCCRSIHRLHDNHLGEADFVNNTRARTSPSITHHTLKPNKGPPPSRIPNPEPFDSFNSRRDRRSFRRRCLHPAEPTRLRRAARTPPRGPPGPRPRRPPPGGSRQ